MIFNYFSKDRSEDQKAKPISLSDMTVIPLPSIKVKGKKPIKNTSALVFLMRMLHKLDSESTDLESNIVMNTFGLEKTFSRWCMFCDGIEKFKPCVMNDQVILLAPGVEIQHGINHLFTQGQDDKCG